MTRMYAGPRDLDSGSKVLLVKPKTIDRIVFVPSRPDYRGQDTPRTTPEMNELPV